MVARSLCRYVVRAVSVAAAIAVASGCDPSVPEPDACDAPDAAAARAVELGTGSLDSVFEPWQDGDVIELVWGGQGSAMFSLRYRVEADTLECMAQRTVVRNEAGDVLLEDTTPLRVYRNEGVGYLTETHWLVFGQEVPEEGTRIGVEAEIGSAAAAASVWVDRVGAE